MKGKNLLVFAFLFLFQLSGTAQYFTPEEAGSSIRFSIRNFGINTKGTFKGLSGKIQFDPKNPGMAKFDVSIEAASIHTGNATRDQHLRSDDFFDVTHFPKIAFKTESVLAGSAPGKYILKGVFTIKGISHKKEILFSVKAITGGYLFEAEFTINRLDYTIGTSSISMSDNASVTIKLTAR